MVGDSTRSSLELLYHISRELATALDLRIVLQRVLSLSVTNIGGERGSIIVLDDREQPIDAAIFYRAQMHTHTTRQLQETVDKGLAGWVVRNRLPALLPDTSQDERWLRRPDDAADQTGAKSAICVPLLAREKLVGVLTVVHPVPGTFTEEHLALMQAIADQAGIAVMNARLYEESQRQARVMTALVENAFALNSTLQLDTLLQRILEQTAQALQVEVVLLALMDENKQDLVMRAATGKGVEPLLGKRIPLGSGVAGRVANDGHGVILSPIPPADAAPLIGLDARALVCVPVQTAGQTIGVLEAVNPKGEAFNPDALLVLTGIGSLAGTALANAQLYENLESAHRRYHELFEDSIDALVITDMHGHILEANRKALLTFQTDEVAFQIQTIDQLHTVQPEIVGEGYQYISKDRTLSYESELTMPPAAGIPVQVMVRRVNIEGTDTLQWTLRDISERKKLDSMREDLIAMIYHDLRSPLANVVSSLDVLNSLISTDQQDSLQTVLAIARRSTDRIQRLISSLLDMRRLEAGMPITNQRETDMLALVHEAVETVQPAFDSKEQKLELMAEDNLPHLSIDTDMIRRVLINLLENASKYSGMSSTVYLGLVRDGKRVQISVEDSGPGIPAGEDEHIFNKYVRLEAPGSPKGIGLGLAFCRIAVEAHGGKIWVQSEPGHGSTFYFNLPVL